MHVPGLTEHPAPLIGNRDYPSNLLIINGSRALLRAPWSLLSCRCADRFELQPEPAAGHLHRIALA